MGETINRFQGFEAEYNAGDASSRPTADLPVVSDDISRPWKDRGFYSKPQDERVEILFPDYGELIVSETDLIIATPKDVEKFDAIHEGQRKTGLMGFPWFDLVNSLDVSIALRSLFETKSWPAAVSMMDELRKKARKTANRLGILEDKILERRKALPFLDIGTGAGSTAVAMAENNDVPAVVLTLESNPVINGLAAENFLKLGVQRVIQSNANAVDQLRRMQRNGDYMLGFGYLGAFFDPPWRSAYYSGKVRVEELRDLYILSDDAMRRLLPIDIRHKLGQKKNEGRLVPEELDNDGMLTGEEVPALILSRGVAPVVSLHIPTNVGEESIRGSLDRLGALVRGNGYGLGAEVVLHRGFDGNRRLEEKQVIFYLTPNPDDLIFENQVVNF